MKLRQMWQVSPIILIPSQLRQLSYIQFVITSLLFSISENCSFRQFESSQSDLTPSRSKSLAFITMTARVMDKLSIWHSFLHVLTSFFQQFWIFYNFRKWKCPPVNLLMNFVYSLVSKCSFKTLEKRGNIAILLTTKSHCTLMAVSITQLVD